MQMSSPQWGFNGGALIEQLRFNAPLTSTDAVINPQRGVGPGSFSRASASYITDFEGITRKVESGSVGVEGSRIVTNLLTYSEDLSNAAWVKSAGVTGYTGGRLVTNGTQVSGSDLVYNASMGTSISGVEYRLNFFVKSNTASTYSINIQQNGVGAKTVSVTPTLTRYNISYTGNGALGIMPIIRSTGGAAIDITFYMQIENVTSQTNTNPGEYVKTTTAAVTKCFSATNANTVNGTTGVVTEATGTALPQSYPDRANSTAYTVGQKIQASGWWYTCTTGGTSHSSAPTWLTGKAGLVTVTDNDITWTLGGRLLLGYVSEPASTNKTTAYGIIPADTLGSELVTNGTFTTDTTSWTAQASSLAVVSGQLAVTYVGVNARGEQAFSTSPGKWYRVTGTLNKGTAPSVKFVASEGSGSYSVLGSTGNVTTATDTVYTFDFQATTISTIVQVYAGVSNTVYADNISVKEVKWAVGTKSFHNGSTFVQNISGLTLSGDVAAVLSIVTDETEIVKAGLANINPTYKVYKLDNSAGSAKANVLVAGTVANTNKHSLSVLARVNSGTGSMETTTYSAPNAVNITNTAFRRITLADITPVGSSESLRVVAGIGQTLYFLLPQLEELPYATSVNPSAGSTSTRAATVLSYPVTGNIPTAGPWTMRLSFVPEGVSTTTTRYLWSSYTDANNYTRLGYNGVILYLEKNVAGVKEYVTKPLVTVANTKYDVVVRRNADGTFNLFVAGAKDAGGLGSELITAQADREFSSDTGFWNKSGTSSIGSDVCNIRGDASQGIYKSSLLTSAGFSRVYSTTYSIVRVGNGSVYVSGSADKYTRSTTGTFTEGSLWAQTSGTFRIYADASSTDIDIDNVSVKEIYNSTTATTPVLATAFQVGSSNSVSQFGGWVKSYSIYAKQLTDSRCISLAP